MIDSLECDMVSGEPTYTVKRSRSSSDCNQTLDAVSQLHLCEREYDLYPPLALLTLEILWTELRQRNQTIPTKNGERAPISAF